MNTHLLAPPRRYEVTAQIGGWHGHKYRAGALPPSHATARWRGERVNWQCLFVAAAYNLVRKGSLMATT